MYEKEYYKTYSKEEFYQVNLKVCHELQVAAGVSEEERVKV
jgi:hypothetical protein